MKRKRKKFNGKKIGREEMKKKSLEIKGKRITLEKDRERNVREKKNVEIEQIRKREREGGLKSKWGW